MNLELDVPPDWAVCFIIPGERGWFELTESMLTLESTEAEYKLRCKGFSDLIIILTFCNFTTNIWTWLEGQNFSADLRPFNGDFGTSGILRAKVWSLLSDFISALPKRMKFSDISITMKIFSIFYFIFYVVKQHQSSLLHFTVSFTNYVGIWKIELTGTF